MTDAKASRNLLRIALCSSGDAEVANDRLPRAQQVSQASSPSREWASLNRNPRLTWALIRRSSERPHCGRNPDHGAVSDSFGHTTADDGKPVSAIDPHRVRDVMTSPGRLPPIAFWRSECRVPVVERVPLSGVSTAVSVVGPPVRSGPAIRALLNRTGGSAQSEGEFHQARLGGRSFDLRPVQAVLKRWRPITVVRLRRALPWCGTS